MKSPDREHFRHDILALATPRQCAKVSFPAQFDGLARAAHQCVGHGIVVNREFQLVGTKTVGGIVARFETALNNLAFVGLENYAWFLEVVEFASIDAGTIDKEETEKDKNGQCHNCHGGNDGDDFGFGGHCFGVNYY